MDSSGLRDPNTLQRASGTQATQPVSNLFYNRDAGFACNPPGVI